MRQQGFLRSHSALILSILRLVDIAVLLAPCAVAYLAIFGSKPVPIHYQVSVFLAILLQTIVFQAYALYRPWRGVNYKYEITTVLAAWTTVFSCLAVLSVLTKTSATYSRAWFIIWFTLGAILLVSMRFLLRRLLQNLRAQGYNLRHIIIIGSGETGLRVYNRLLSAPETGFKVAGYFDDNSSPTLAQIPSRIARGPTEDAASFLSTHRIDQVWLAMPLKEAARIEAILNSLQHTTADVRLVPDFFGFRLINHSVSTIADMPVINLSVTPMDGANRWLKLVEDKLLSVAILIPISPLMLLIAIVIKLSDPGPILYGQPRLSWNGREFTMYKFRTMPVNAEASTGAIWASPDDNRASRFGSFLRRTSLDELPQFWNVLKGDMSIVGPRPERRVFVDKFKHEIPNYMQKHMVKGGITGWAQVNGWRGDTDLDQRIEHDLYYIENWSLWLDLKIILLTLTKGFVHKNAY